MSDEPDKSIPMVMQCCERNRSVLRTSTSDFPCFSVLVRATDVLPCALLVLCFFYTHMHVGD